MPISTKNLNGHNPNLQDVPAVEEAEVVEEDVFAQEQIATEIEEEVISPEPKVEVGLRSFIPVTKEDFEAGFRLLTQEEKDRYGLHDRALFRVREDAGKHILNLSSQQVGKHVKQLLESKPPYPRGYLMDAQGLTDRCLFEIFQKIENTAKNILPGNPADWRRLKKSRKEFNPKYKTHRFKYWEEHSRRCQEYYQWLESQPEPEFEVHDAEFVPPSEEQPEDREERLSKKRSAIQRTEADFEGFIRNYMRQKREIVLRIVEEEALETKHQMDLRHDEIISNPDITAPPELDEDEDL
ncbi:MAG TPA: hypothetical protein V6D33_09065 [Cyanophyceae cyanobacterium]